MNPRFRLVPALAVTLTLLGGEKPQEAVQLTPEKPFATVKVGQIVYLGLDDPRPPKSLIRDLLVKIDGHWVELKAGECKRTGPPGAGWFSFAVASEAIDAGDGIRLLKHMVLVLPTEGGWSIQCQFPVGVEGVSLAEAVDTASILVSELRELGRPRRFLVEKRGG